MTVLAEPSTAPPLPSAIRTRADVVAFGRAGSPWRFVPLAHQVLAQVPHDHEVRFLLAAAYGKVGLRTPGLEQIDALPEEVRRAEPVAAMRAALESLADDRIRVPALVATARANADAIARRGVTISAGDFDRWAAGLAAYEHFRSTSGHVLRRRAGAVGGWTRFDDDAGAAATIGRSPAGTGLAGSLSPVLIDGVCPPWILRRVHETTPDNKDGSRTRISVVAEETADALDGLAMSDLTAIIGDERVEWFVGADAILHLEHTTRARLDEHMGESVHVSPGTCSPRRGGASGGDSRVVSAMTRLVAQAQAATDEAIARVRRRDAARSARWWGDRYREALPVGAGARRGPEPIARPSAPLRVLVVTTRFSTYLRHAAGDLADALRAAGCDARLMIERGPCSRPTPLAYAGELDRFDPDLVVLINYTRRHLEPVLPPGVPVVTWLQDAMPHLFDPRQGGSLGAMDFVIGHVHEELFTKFGYPRERVMHTPVVASARKFHPAPAPPALAERYACEIAYVSHQSERPCDARDRLVRESRALGDKGPAVVEGLYAGVVAAATRGVFDGVVQPRIREVVVETLRRVLGREPSDRERAVTEYSVARPIADRAIRHQTLRWAANIAERRGWRLRVHGRGWESHPRFARYARGEITHDEELRACYQGAAAHVHASISGNLHQRVMECALSGGLPLVRLKRDDLCALEQNVHRRMSLVCDPWASAVSDRSAWMLALDFPEAAALVGLFQRFGLDHLGGFKHTTRLRDGADVAARFERATLLPAEAAWLCGDLSETGFDSEPSLEALLVKAVERPAWRESLSRGIAARVRRGLTFDAVAARTLAMVRASLCEPASSHTLPEAA